MTPGPSGAFEITSDSTTWSAGLGARARTAARAERSWLKASQRPAKYALVTSSSRSMTTGVNVRLFLRKWSAMSPSLDEPGWMQIVAPFRSMTDRTFDALRTMNPVPSYQLMAGNSMPSWTSRWKVTVVLRERMSTSPDWSAV